MVETPSILIVEDDEGESGLFIQALVTLIPKARVGLIETEHQFRTRFPEFTSNPPDLVVMDILLPWCSPGSDMPKHPDDVEIGGFFTAGLRCQRLLSGNPATENTTVLLFSCIDLEDLGKVRYSSDNLDGVYFLGKNDVTVSQFAQEVSDIIEGKVPQFATRLSVWNDRTVM